MVEVGMKNEQGLKWSLNDGGYIQKHINNLRSRSIPFHFNTQ
jgi:hypothetical protein